MWYYLHPSRNQHHLQGSRDRSADEHVHTKSHDVHRPARDIRFVQWLFEPVEFSARFDIDQKQVPRDIENRRNRAGPRWASYSHH